MTIQELLIYGKKALNDIAEGNIKAKILLQYVFFVKITKKQDYFLPFLFFGFSSCISLTISSTLLSCSFASSTIASATA